MAELEELEQEQLDEELLNVHGVEDLPSVPVSEPTQPRPAKSEFS